MMLTSPLKCRPYFLKEAGCEGILYLPSTGDIQVIGHPSEKHVVCFLQTTVLKAPPTLSLFGSDLPLQSECSEYFMQKGADEDVMHREFNMPSCLCSLPRQQTQIKT